MESEMEPLKDASHYYEVERRARHAERPGFRINELTISPTQQVPWHFHSNVQDTFYVLEGRIRGDLLRCATPPAPRDQWRHHPSHFSHPAGHRRVRLRAARPAAPCRPQRRRLILINNARHG
jgi:hypothetical protein